MYDRSEDNREDPVVPCRCRADADPVGRDLPEQHIRGDLGNPGIHLRPDRDSQSGLRTGIRAGGIEDDSRWIRDLHGSGHRGMVRGYNNCGECWPA